MGWKWERGEVMNAIMDLKKEGRLKRNFWCGIHLQCSMQCWWLFWVLWTWDNIIEMIDYDRFLLKIVVCLRGCSSRSDQNWNLAMKINGLIMFMSRKMYLFSFFNINEESLWNRLKKVFGIGWRRRGKEWSFAEEMEKISSEMSWKRLVSRFFSFD